MSKGIFVLVEKIALTNPAKAILNGIIVYYDICQTRYIFERILAHSIFVIEINFP